MTSRSNLLYSITGSSVAAVVGFLIVPSYVHYLGGEAYGLLGFYATTQALLQFFDFGLAPTINREVARRKGAEAEGQLATLLTTVGRIYAVVAVASATTFVLSASWISTSWIRPSSLNSNDVVVAIRLMGLLIAFRWPIGLYQNVLLGAQLQRTVAGITVASSVLGGLGGVIVLRYFSPTLSALFCWQGSVSVFQLVLGYLLAWRVVGTRGSAGFDIGCLRDTWKFSAAMVALNAGGLMFTQLDKVLLTHFVSLTEFARYSLATTAAGSLTFIVGAFYNTAFPRFAALAASEANQGGSWEAYIWFTRMIATAMFPVGALLAVFSESFLFVWTGDAELAQSVSPLLSIIILGTAIHGVMYIPYAMQLAQGYTRGPLMLVAMLAVVMVPAIAVLSVKYGAQGASYAWLALQVIYLVLGTALMHRAVFRGRAWEWFAGSVLPALFVSAAFGVLGAALKPLAATPYIELALGVLIGMFAVAANVLIYPSARARVVRMVVRERI